MPVGHGPCWIEGEGVWADAKTAASLRGLPHGAVTRQRNETKWTRARVGRAAARACRRPLQREVDWPAARDSPRASRLFGKSGSASAQGRGRLPAETAQVRQGPMRAMTFARRSSHQPCGSGQCA